MRSFFTKTAATALAVTALAVSFSGCTRSEEDPKLAIVHSTLADDMKTLDPANAYDSVSLDVVPDIYETLFQYDYLSKTYKLVPLLAADMPKFSADKLTLTIPIRHGVLFQDDPCFANGKGRELTAQDFIYGWKRLADPLLESQGWWIWDGKIKGINAFHDALVKAKTADERKKLFDAPVEGMKALDNYTIQVQFTQPYPEILYTLAMSFAAPVPHEAVEKYADEKGNLTEHPVGTGPYTLKKWEHNRIVVMNRNPNYHADFYPSSGDAEYRAQGLLADAGKKLPLNDRVVLSIIKEDQPRWLGFLKGDFDVMGIPKDNFNQAITNQVNLSPELASKGMKLAIDTGVTFYYISFNMKDKLIGKNKLLREALSAAINRDKWIEIFTNNRGTKQITALPPGILDRPANPKLKYDFDLTKAKELLAKAGFPGGKGLPTISFDLRGADAVNRQMGEFFAQQWGAIGIKVNAILNTFPAYLEKARNGNLQVSMGGWQMDYPDAENVYQLLYGPNQSPGPNETNYDNPEMNKLYKQMATMESGPKRAAIVQKMDDILQDDSPWALGYYGKTYALSQGWLANYRPSDIITNRYKYFRVDKEAKNRYLKK